MWLEMISMNWKLIDSRFLGKCVVCGGEIATGAQVYWKRRQTAHVACINGQRPTDDSPNQPEPREEKVRPLGNIRYAAPGEPAPDAGEWEYRKTSKKGNRVYVRRP